MHKYHTMRSLHKDKRAILLLQDRGASVHNCLGMQVMQDEN
jgi:hypothetical protein